MRLIICLLFITCGQFASAQTWEEWTQQKETAIKRLLEQIAANNFYIEYAKKGYSIVTNGLHTIRDIKNGDFHLHLGFIDSLKVVNPFIKKWVKVADIIAMQLRILKMYHQSSKTAEESLQFTRDERAYCNNLFEHLVRECEKCIDELMIVITSGESAMSDDDRINRIEKIYLDMQDKKAFVTSFTNEISTLALQRLTERIEIDYSRKINSY